VRADSTVVVDVRAQTLLTIAMLLALAASLSYSYRLSVCFFIQSFKVHAQPSLASCTDLLSYDRMTKINHVNLENPFKDGTG
jgi:hypothetical protein